jgi:hypothetical protein
MEESTTSSSSSAMEISGGTSEPSVTFFDIVILETGADGRMERLIIQPFEKGLFIELNDNLTRVPGVTLDLICSYSDATRNAMILLFEQSTGVPVRENINLHEWLINKIKSISPLSPKQTDNGGGEGSDLYCSGN